MFKSLTNVSKEKSLLQNLMREDQSLTVSTGAAECEHCFSSNVNTAWEPLNGEHGMRAAKHEHCLSSNVSTTWEPLNVNIA